MSMSIVAGSIMVEQFGSIRVNENGMISVYDLIQVCAEYGSRKSRYEAWKRLVVEYPEVSSKIGHFKFEGKAQKETPVASKENALYILGLLPGVTGKKYRELAAKLVLSYLENPEQLAEVAIAKLETKEQLDKVNSAVRRKYLEKGYHPAMEEIKERAEGDQWAYIAVNKVTTQAVTGHTPKEIQAMRYEGKRKTPPSARQLMTDSELSLTENCHTIQAMSLKQNDVQGSSKVVEECSRVAEEFNQFLRRVGL